MFVRCKRRFKDGKEHRYWSVVENVRVRGGRRVVQRHILYLGEINDSQRAAWCRSIEVVEGKSRSRRMALFPNDRDAPALDCEVVRINVSEVSLHDPRQWGACWLALNLWGRLDLDRFWGERLPPSRQGTRWLDILKILACYRLIDPGSEWRLHRHWYEHSALRDLLGSDRAIADDTLYRCLDKLLEHKQDFFSFLRARWTTLFDARFDVLLYDLTSTYFESDPPFADKRRFGYSRDKRPDCVQVVIALIVTPDGFPLLADTDPDALQEVLVQWAAPRLAEAADPPALAADGKRIRSVNRHATDSTRFETVTLVTRAGRPLASRCCREEGGDRTASIEAWARPAL